MQLSKPCLGSLCFRAPLLASIVVLCSWSGASADIITFSNTAPIIIPRIGQANPYPSTINVSGVVGPLANITVTLDRFSHLWPDDVGAVVVSPNGTAALLFTGAGADERVSNATFVFDENAASRLPEEGALVSGTYKPGTFQWDDDFPAPGPRTNYGLTFQPWLNENPNGGWNLFVMDSNAGDSGNITGGWSMSFNVSAVPEPTTVVLSTLAFSAIALRHRAKLRNRK